MGVTLLLFGRDCADSFSNYLLAASCVTDACFTQVPELDVIGPMSNVATLAVLSGKMAGDVCGPIATLAEVVLFPLADPKLAQAVHQLVNAVLATIVYLPIVTGKRCTEFGKTGTQFDILMCTPDIEVVKVYLVAGVRALGQVLDNWIAVVFNAIHTKLSNEVSTCELSRGVTPDTFRKGVLMGNMTTIGLTDWLLATTNGTHAAFFTPGSASSTVTLQKWEGSGVDVTLGVAAVKYGTVNEAHVSSLTQGRQPGAAQTTTLLGCRCFDSSAGIVVRCSLLPFAGVQNATATVFDVAWQDETWRGQLQCSTVEVTVRSVRWPVRRFVGAAKGSMGQPQTSCTTRGTCEVVDATIWLVPKCMYLPGALCSSDAIGTSCFPYCLATRKSGSMNQQPVFVTAATWRAGRQLMDRDCTSEGGSQNTVSSGFAYSGTSSLYSLSFSGSSLVEGSSPLYVGSTTFKGCSVGIQTVSWVNASNPRRLPFSLLNGQPFAIAGDAILIRSPKGDGGMQVVSERLIGDQQNVFTMQDTAIALASMPVPSSPLTPLMPADEHELQYSLVVPPTFSATRVLATSTHQYVFYATNPDLTIFKAYFDYCMDKATNSDRLPRIQEMLLSSYSPLRVYRACAFAHCVKPTAHFTWNGFGNGNVSMDSFTLQCNKRFNFTIIGLEFVNDANIAVTVGETTDAFDPEIMQGLETSYQTWWLHPETMAVRGDDMWTDPVPGIGETTTCLTLRSMPTIGAMFASLFNAGIFFVGTFVEAMVITPGVMSVWRGGGACALECAGHSVLERCTANYLILDDFFDSLEDATVVFWGSLSYLSNLLDDSGVAYTPVHEVLTGLSIYGSATVDILDAGGAAHLLSVPVVQEIRGVYMSIIKQDFAAASVKPIVSTTSLARYFTLMLVRIGKDTVRKMVSPGTTMTASVAYNVFMDGLYESRADFQNTVIQKGLTGCSGLGEIFGSSHNNPIGQLSADLCASSIHFINGVFDLWLVTTIDVDLVRCVCQEAAGQGMNYVSANCIPTVPPYLHGVLLGVSQGLRPDLMCSRLMPKVSLSIHDTMEPWFHSMYIALDTMSNVIDYTMINFDSAAGQCLNVEQDPFIVVIMPQPVDYFQSCGTTDMCHSRCNSEWTNLQKTLSTHTSLSALSKPVVMTSTLESSFFPVGGDAVRTPGKIVALSQPSDGRCGEVCRAETEGCVSVAYFFEGLFNINLYCIPLSPTQNVYLSSHETAHWETACSECNLATNIQFIDAEGTGVIMTISQSTGNYLQLVRKDGTKLVLLNATIRDASTIQALTLADLQAIVIQDVLVVTSKMFLVNVVARSGEGVTGYHTVCVIPGYPALTHLSTPSLPSMAGYMWSLYPVTGVVSKTFLLWPKSPKMPAKLTVAFSNRTVSKITIDTLSMSTEIMGSNAGMITGAVLSYNGVQDEKAGVFVSWLYSGQTYDWLNQLRVNIDTGVQTATLHNSIQSAVTVEQLAQCDGSDCSGCPPSIRPLCSIYQSCSVSKCIGTPVNMNRPLCGVGLMLRALGLTQVETLHGAWGILVQVFVVILQLEFDKNLQKVDLSAQEQAFFGHVCAAKDVSAEFFATVIASVGSVFQYQQAQLQLLQYASFVDAQVYASPQLGPAALTSFFHHMALAPLYVISTLYQIFICRLSAMLTFIGDTGGTRITLSSSTGTEAGVGQCLTMYTAGLTNERGDPFSREKLVQTAANFMIIAYNAGVLAVLDPIMHSLDALFTYLTGIVSSFADVLRTFDMIHCVTPDLTLESTAQCACGDDPVKISTAREVETDKDFAYWCTGTLSLLGPDQLSKLVWNPYSFAYLRSLMKSHLNTFLSCSKDATKSCSIPNDPIFASQGVTSMQVFTRCRQNYVNKQWDIGAYAQYDAAILKKKIPSSINPIVKPPDKVGPCLLNAFNTGQNNQACADDFFRLQGWIQDVYWSYQESESKDPSLVDACIVFSGPAQNTKVELDRSAVFANCLGSGITDDRCDFSGFVWSPSSYNSIPVASIHVIEEAPNDNFTKTQDFLNEQFQALQWNESKFALQRQQYLVETRVSLNHMIASTVRSLNTSISDGVFRSARVPWDTTKLLPDYLQALQRSWLFYFNTGDKGHAAELVVQINTSLIGELRAAFANMGQNYNTFVERGFVSATLFDITFNQTLQRRLADNRQQLELAIQDRLKGSVRQAVEERYTQAFQKLNAAFQDVNNDGFHNVKVGLFSAEGDVIHQLLDCLFLGPFARMDYWPLPFCSDSSSECLQGPSWSRDDGKGITRNIDPSTCNSTTTLPFTCGSSTRKRMIKYFADNYVAHGEGHSNHLVEQVQTWTSSMAAKFGSFSNYQCPCSAVQGGGSSPYCCANLSLLTANMTAVPDFFISSESILNNIHTQAELFYNESLFYVEPWVSKLSEEDQVNFDWANLDTPFDIVNAARYDTTQPSKSYTQEEALSPPRSTADQGLWGVCHGAVRKIMFTLPIDSTGGLKTPPDSTFFGGGPEVVAAYVAQIVAAAFEESPLYYHYVPRHAPSNSRMCSQPASPSKSMGSLSFSNVTVGGSIIFRNGSVSPINVHGVEYGSIGAWENSCFCGWVLDSDFQCHVPPDPAAQLGYNIYSLDEQDREFLIQLDTSTWRTGSCPELELSELFGILDRDSSEAWLRGNKVLQTSGRHLLKFGPGGLKVGNAPGIDRAEQNYDGSPVSIELSELIRSTITPNARQSDPSGSILHTCDVSKKTNVEDLLTDFVDDLFPMAQGITESPSFSYCLRFAVELAKLKALEIAYRLQMVSRITEVTSLLRRVEEQQVLTETWQRRCGTQVQLVSMCEALDIYRPHPTPLMLSLPSPCSLWTVNPSNNTQMYITSGCLLSVNKVFYDPCECFPSLCGQNSTQPFVFTPSSLSSGSCRLSLDPRTIIQSSEMGWWSKESIPDGKDVLRAKANSWQSTSSNLLHFDRLLASALNLSSTMGNVFPGEHWTTANGFMNTSSLYCDMISDYWPDDFSHPVGYHVTVPCLAEETGYRSFDHIFALDDMNEFVYMEDQTRDLNKVDSHFGEGGLCRTTNFGYNMFKTNSMRVCTRVRADDDNIDIHVPGVETDTPFDKELCSADSSELPWADESLQQQGMYDPLMYNVGTFPFLPDKNADYYPDPSELGVRPPYKVGPVHSMLHGGGWGSGCSDFNLPTCVNSATDCAVGFKCIQGVCMDERVECVSHEDCRLSGKMCSGVGQCLPPMVTVHNTLSVPTSFRVHTDQCGTGTSYSMLGASSWGYVPELLKSHGMCSYRDWAAYLNTWKTCVRNDQQGQNVGIINMTQCELYMRSLGVDRSTSQNVVKWWDQSSTMGPNMPQLKPVSCDRDYERLQKVYKDPSSEMKGCVPNLALGSQKPIFRSASGEQTTAATRERILRLQNMASKTMALRKMPFLYNPTSGFLNQGNASASLSTDRCSSLKQCFVADFTWNGKLRMTTVSKGGLRTANRTLSDGSLYNAQDTFMCGVFARFNTVTQTCQIDVKVVPLYHLFCVKGVYESSDPRQWCKRSMGVSGQTELLNLCESITAEYSPSYTTVRANAVALAALFNVLGTTLPTDLSSNINNVECAVIVYKTINMLDTGRRTLYYPFEFVLYEFPFPWFYQCIMGLHMTPSLSQGSLVSSCASYSRATVSNIKTYEKTSSDFVSYAQTVRGGYRYDSVQNYTTKSRNTATSLWQQCVIDVKKNKFGINTTDGSAPFCAHEKHWRCLPSSKCYNKFLSNLVQTFMYPTCSATIQLRAITMYNSEGDHGVEFPVLSSVGLANLEDLQTKLVELKKVNRQVSFAPTLLDEIAEWGRYRLLQNTAHETQVSGVDNDYPVTFDTSIPDSTSAEFQLLLATVSSNTNNIPKGDTTDATVVYGDVPNCGTYVLEPLYTPSDSSTFTGTPIKVCPLHSKGRFQCAYEPYVRLDQSKVKFSSTEGNMETYFTGLFDAVHTCYSERVSVSPSPISTLPPQTLTFFEEESSLGFTSPLRFSFDLSYVAKYNTEIDPTTTQSVMCVVGNQQLSFTNCTDANFASLQTHVQEQYTQDGPIIIPAYWQMEWPADANMLFADSIYAFASTERQRKHQYVWNMMNSDSCISRSTTNFNRVCVSGANAAVLNPWMGGSWNPFDGCDSYKTLAPTGDHHELIDATCEVGPPWCNPVDNDMSNQHCNSVTGTHCFYKNMPKKPDRSSCTSRDGQKTVSPNLDPSMYNLCSHQLEEDPICQHNQGVLGGGDGFSTDANPDYVNMYTLQTLNYTEGFGDYLFANPLFTGSCDGYNYGVLQMKKTHLGGHNLGLKIELPSSNASVACLRVAKLPLRAVENKILADWNSDDVKNWVKQLPRTIEEDSLKYQATLGNPDLIDKSWDCPLRRRAFYSGSVSDFGPSLPSARRSRRLFGHMTDDSYAHPTQKRASSSERFGNYHTYNGFCFCPILENPNDESCKWTTDANPIFQDHPCSVMSMAQAIQGTAWKSSHTWVSQPSNVESPCMVQLDWPFVGGDLRDGSTLTTAETDQFVWESGSNVEGRQCHVLDRMKEFKYTYRSLGPRLALSEFNTIDHGVCHTGRVQRKLNLEDRCVRLTQNGGDSRLLCHENVFASGSVSAQRRSSRLTTKNQKRQRCSQCSPPPRFKTRKGAYLYPESSFGIPYRFSSERVMANDLKEALCGNVTECLEGLNHTAWRKGRFAQNLFTNPERLFKNHSGLIMSFDRSQEIQPVPPPDTASLWETPWMYCPTKTSLMTGQNCTGAITREQWRTSKRRLCPLAIQEGSGGQSNQMAMTSVCEISESLNKLCNAITEARSLIGAANCLKESNSKGDAKCAIKEHVYTPATWENSNIAFVHDTVRNFYKRLDGCPGRDETDCVCPVDYNLTSIILQNQKRLKTCSAKDASAVALFLNQARGLVVQLTRVVSTTLYMILQFVLTLQGGDIAKTAQKNLYQSWHTLSSMMTNTKSVVSDIGTNTLLMNGVVGPALRTAISDACGAYNFALDYFQTTFCTVFILKFPLLAAALDDVFGYVEIALKTINDFILVCVEAIIPQALVAMVAKGYYAMYSAAAVASRSNAVENERLLLRNTGVLTDLVAASGTTQDAKVADSLAKMKEAAAQVKSSTSNKNPLNWVNNAKNVIATSFGKVAGVGVLLDIGLIGYEMAQAAQQAQEYENAKKVAQKVWSIVDFSTVRVILRDLRDFLFGTSGTCTDPPTHLSCPNFTLPNEGTSSDSFVPPSPTQCWADAQVQEIGTTNLYACSASSTCLLDAVSGVTSLCAECPLQKSVLYRPFGCNVQQQRCQCNILSLQTTGCMSNRDCNDNAFCQVLSDVRATSFGVNMCGQCTTPGICLVHSPGSVGSCTCLTKGDAFQKCDAALKGKHVIPAPPLLDLVTSDGQSETYIWESSALISASQVRQAICVAVSTDSGQSLPPTMALATSVFPTTVAAAGRRLLSEVKSEWDYTDYPDFFAAVLPADHLAPALIETILMAPGWNTTAAPCSTVVVAYQNGQQMTPADENLAHSCAYWRHVGGIIIHQFNLTALQEMDTFLLSPDDFSSAISRKGVISTLLAQPRALVTAAMYSSWLKPIRAAFWLHFHKHFRGIIDQSTWLTDKIKQHTQSPQKVVGNVSTVTPSVIEWQLRESVPKQVTTHRSDTVSMNQITLKISKPGRRLLNTATQVVLNLKSSPFYNLFSVNTPELRNGSMHTCPPAKVALGTGLEIGHVMHTYYTQFENIYKDRNLSATLLAVLPNLGFSTPVTVGLNDLSQLGTYSDFAVRTTLGLFGLSVDDMIAFFKEKQPKSDVFSLDFIVRTLTSCDFPSLMYCQNHTRDFFFTLIFGFFTYMFVEYVTSLLGMRVLAVLYFYLLPVIALWYSYGVSPTCLPMIPPCLMDDLLTRWAAMFPRKTTLPKALLCSPPSSTCLVSCTQLGFTSWQDPIAFAAAALGVADTFANASWVQEGLTLLTISDVTSNLRRKQEMVNSEDYDAYATCAVVNAVAVLPVLLSLIAIVSLAGAIVIYVFSLMPSVVTMAWHVMTFDEEGG